MKVTDLNKRITQREGKKKEVNIAQVGEVVKVLREIILEECGLDIYRDVINKI